MLDRTRTIRHDKRGYEIDTATEYQPTTLTPKALKTRERILDSALELFASQGYQETTLREIAARAGSSLGLTYRYFSRKEELVLALYARLAQELDEEVERLPRGRLSARFALAMKADLARLAPHRTALGSLFGAGLAPASSVALLGEQALPLRATTWRTCLKLVSGASDTPRPEQARQVATILYATYLCVVLFWLQDRSQDQRLSARLLDFGRDMLRMIRPLMGFTPVSRSVTRLAGILGPMFGPPDDQENPPRVGP